MGKRGVSALVVVVVVAVTVVGKLAFARHELETSTSRAPAAVVLRKAVDVASGKTIRCPGFRVTAPSGDASVALIVRRVRARGVSCGQARAVMGGWLELPFGSGERVRGYRCSAMPTDDDFNATCTRGSRRVTASYG